MKKEPIYIKTYAGDHIHDVFKKALRMAWRKNRIIKFEFNEYKFTIRKRLSERHLRKQWEHMLDASSLRWRNSKEGREYFAEREAEVIKNQSEIDKLMSNLVSATNLDEILNWFELFVPLADDIRIRYNGAEIVKFLTKAGYSENYGVGERKHFFENKENLGRYIIGQCINCMNRGMPPHPICVKFIKDYNNIEDEKA